MTKKVKAKAEPAPVKRRFRLELTCYLDIDVDQRVIDAVDDEWRSVFYRNIVTPEDVAMHIGSNRVRNHAGLNMLDGFANLPPDLVRVVAEDWDETEAYEVEPEKAKKVGRRG